MADPVSREQKAADGRFGRLSWRDAEMEEALTFFALTGTAALGQHEAMEQQQQKVKLVGTPDYREGYANSVQVRVNLWDFFLQFGTVNQTAADAVEIRNFQGVYLSPQQAKALCNILTQNIGQYERAFGEIKIDPNAQQAGAIN